MITVIKLSYPHVVVAAEREALVAGVREGRVELHGEVEVLIQVRPAGGDLYEMNICLFEYQPIKQ